MTISDQTGALGAGTSPGGQIWQVRLLCVVLPAALAAGLGAHVLLGMGLIDRLLDHLG
jgi:hypothetical protein